VGTSDKNGKFTVMHPSGTFAKFKAQTQQEAEEWIRQIKDAVQNVNILNFCFVFELFSYSISTKVKKADAMNKQENEKKAAMQKLLEGATSPEVQLSLPHTAPIPTPHAALDN
jgi:hypothetical protein